MNRDRRFIIVVLVALACGATLRLPLAFRHLDTIDRMFIPDDTYYTLSVARSLAGGNGPTVDGTTLTTGFQPLLAFLLIPVYRLTASPDTPIRAALVIATLADLACILLLARIARRVAGTPAAMVAAGLWALSPVAIANALGGLETSLALCLELALVDAWCLGRGARPTARYALLGALAGLALLARIDAAFLIAILGLFELWNGDRRRLMLAAAAALLVVGPWWSWEILYFGSPVPESGAAVRNVVALHQRLYLDTAKQVGWAAGTLIGTPVVDAQGLREWLFGHPWLSWVAWCTTAGLGVLAGRAWLRVSQGGAPVVALAIHAGLLLAFYTFELPALWFFRRYLAPVEIVVTLLLALGFAAAWRRPGLRRVAVALAMIAFIVEGITSASYLWARPSHSTDAGLHGAKGYRQAARDILALVPGPGPAVVGAFQSGALSYYAPARVRIVNLDGVVDRRAAEAGRSRQLSDYAHERGVAYLADWRFNLENFRRLSDRSAIAPRPYRVIGTARPQGANDRFILVDFQ